MNMQRKLSNAFETDLKTGRLKSLLDTVRKDDTLMLAIRNDCINIYYRGGSLLKLKQKIPNVYTADFNPNYAKAKRDGVTLPDCEPIVRSADDIDAWIASFPSRKQCMDFYFNSKRRKNEREFQQLVVWENNNSRIAQETRGIYTSLSARAGKLSISRLAIIT